MIVAGSTYNMQLLWVLLLVPWSMAEIFLIGVGATGDVLLEGIVVELNQDFLVVESCEAAHGE